MGWFADCFEDLQDPGTENAQHHDLLDLLTIAPAASVCGGESCVDFAEMKEPLLRPFLRLEGGLPSHDTVSRIVPLLDPQAFSASFSRFARGWRWRARRTG